ncbi:MAG: DUF4170 domain-containing protein [Alphaproteobacteria bacterium]|nr:DUF4170 domain-containing protein [Alphaproteobacteria bacterium]MDX5368220.1 DUF4170 domain-containing protein [Alphaproteobacteria bacterium]MDX5463029.1 DUF4170 domain-containing protein [Alphaproteobacteria bacterium]
MAQSGLHLVFGGELKSLDGTEFVNPDKIDVIGIYPTYAKALSAWRAAAQATVDHAMVRYFIADLTRLRTADDPSKTPESA